MEEDLHSFGENLNRFIAKKLPNEAERFIGQINRAFTESELPAFTIDTYILNIFNESTGLLNFLKQIIHKTEYKKVKFKCFELLYTLVNNCTSKIQRHLLSIIKTCIPVIRSSAGAFEKQKSLGLITLVIQKGNFYADDVSNADDEISELYNSTLFKCLHNRFDNSNIVQEELLVAIGAVAKKFPAAISNPTELRNVLVNQLNRELQKSDKSLPVIAGAVSALSNYLENFPFDPVKDKSIADTIYKCVKLLADPGDASRRVAFRESLALVSKHMVLLKSFLYPETIWWHTTLLKWFNLGPEDKKAAYSILETFYKETANILSTQREENDAKIFKHFIDYFVQVVVQTSSRSSSLENYEIRLAIRGFGFFAAAFKFHATPHEINKTFITISQIMEHTYLLNPEPDSDQVQYLPDFIQTLSFITKNLPELNNSHITSLQRVSIVMIKIFPQISTIQHHLVIDAFVIASFQLQQCGGKALEMFLEDIVYQGILWTCSHPIAMDAELYKDETQVIFTYKNYLPLWNGYLNIINTTKYEKYGINMKIRKFLVQKLLDEFIKTLFVLINKLNLSTKLKDADQHTTDPGTAYEAFETNDFVIFVNVVDLYHDILEKTDPGIFKRWIIIYMNKIIAKSVKNPLVSGFYKLAAICLKICDELNYFEESKVSSREDLNACYQSVSKYLQEVMWKMKQFKGDLQIACLHIVLAAPVYLIKDILPCAVLAFITLFDVGRSYIKLADLGIDTLDRWLKHLPLKDFEPFLKQILPALDSYLTSRSLGGNITSDLALKGKKTKRALNKRKVLVQTEPELLKLQVKILSFIGQLNSSLCVSYVNSGNNIESVVWNKTPYLKITLPYTNTKLNLYLDKFTPRIIELAVYSSDRKIRLAACELLHSVVMIILGISHPLEPSKQKDLDSLLTAVVKPVIKLGCDMDEMVQQLYSPLAQQLMHYYSHPRQMYSSHTQIVIETLIDAICNPSDSTLRDFAGSCIKEFITWTIKQADQEDLRKNPISIKIWIRTIESFSVHPDPFKRLGSALIFNNIYTVLREEPYMFSMFWLEILYAFVINLSLTQMNNVDENNCIEQVSLALNHVQRGLTEKHALFNKTDKERRQPPSLDGILLKDVAIWLLKETGSNNAHCRQKCMVMFCKIAPLVANCQNDLNNFKKLYLNNDEWITTTYEQELIKTPTIKDLKNTGSVNDLFEWMQGLLCALDGYIFAVSDKLIPTNFTSKTSKFFVSLQFFLEHMQSRNIQEVLSIIPGGENVVHAITEKENYNYLKSTTATKIIELAITLSANISDFTYATDTPELFWGNHFWELICHCIFNPQILGFDITNCANSDLVLKLLNKINDYASVDVLSSLTNSLSANIINKFVVSTDIGANLVSIKQRQLLNGMLLLQESLLAEKLHIKKYTTGSVNKVMANLIENKNGEKLLKKLHKSAHDFSSLKLQLALDYENEFCDLIKFLCNNNYVKNEQNEEIWYENYIFEKYKDTIIKHILKNYMLFMDVVLKSNAINHAITYMLEVFRYIQRNPRNVKQEIIQEIAQISIDNWQKMHVHFDVGVKEKLLGLEFIDKLSRILIEPLFNLAKEKPAIVQWVISLFYFEDSAWTEEASINFKSEVLTVLPYVIGHFSACELELRNALKILKHNYFDKETKLQITHVTTFKKLLNAVKISKSTILLRYAAEIYVTACFNTKDIELKFTLKPFIRYTSTENQINSLQLIYDMCFASKTESFSPTQRYAITKDILPFLVQNCHYSVFQQFYSNVINSILSVLDKKNNPTSFSMIHIVNKTIAYIFIELLFSRIKIEKFGDDTCPISKAAFQSEPPSNKLLLRTLTRVAVEVCKENYNLNRQEEREVFRLYQCHTYNALVAMISNTQKDIAHYDTWLFGRETKQDKDDILWKNLVDVNKKYTFEIDFDKVPSMRKVLVNIRSDIHAAQKNLDPNIHTAKYIESQHLFKSTLSEDITRFDFSHSVLRSQSDQMQSKKEGLETKPGFEITLESIDINQHECMATVCGLIQHLVENDISPLPSENEDVSLPKWMKTIRSVMMSENTHNNVRIFLTKVIHNTQYTFKPYAKWFFAPLIKVIVDGCLGSTMNFFIADIVVMLTSWSDSIIPNEDTALASKLLKFLMENVDNDRRPVFKYNLEQIKLVIEAWKQCLEIPHDLIYSKLQLEKTSKKLDVGVHLAAVLLANNIAPWQPTEVKKFLMALCKVMKSENRTVYQPCAEVLGMSLLYMSADINTMQHLHSFTGYIHKCLSEFIDEDDKFAYCLQGLVPHHPVIADKYLARLVAKLRHIHGNFKGIYLKIFLARTDTLNSLNELSSIHFQQLLSEEDLEVQVLTLEMIEKSIQYLRTDYLIPVLKDVTKFVNNTFTVCRVAMYDIFITAYNYFSRKNGSEEIIEICRDVLLQGLMDKESAIQEKINVFWSGENNLPSEIPNIFLFFLNTMYKPNIEEHYVSYCAYLLLNALKSSEEFGEKLFEYVLYECDFHDYNLICNWRRQHASMAPLFADSLRSQEFSATPMNPNVLRATVSTLEFRPTQAANATSASSSKYLTNTNSSLLFSVNDESRSQSGVFKDPNVVLPKAHNIRSRRFLRDKSKVSRHFAYLEVRKSLKAEESRKERVKQSERDVTVYRKYRIGDYPDIEITLSSIITPLQVLIRCDAALARHLYTSIFESLMKKIEKDCTTNTFIQNVNSGINDIFNTSIQFVPTTIGTFLDVALKYKHTMQFDPNIISSVCQGSGLLCIGSLLLEEYLRSQVDHHVPTKRSRGVESESTIHWVKFAELYKEMDEWDVVSAVFMEKMNCSEIVLNAIEAESIGQWRSAQEFYSQVIEEDTSQDRKDFYYESYFKCFAALAEWDKLSDVIQQTVAIDSRENVWTSLWDNDWNQEKLLPWYITAELRNILGGVDRKLFASVNEFLTDPEKSEYLKSNFGEELAMLCLLQNNVDTADHYLNHSITNFLENWSHLNPLFVKLRTKKVLKLRNMIEIYLFIKIFNKININNQDDILESLLKSWQETCDSTEPLLSNETRTVYRNQFISVLKTKLHSILNKEEVQTVNKSFNSCKFNIHINLIENALQQGNYYVARKYIKLSARPDPNSNVQNMQWSLALSKILFLRAQMLENNNEKLSLMVDSWSKIGVPNVSTTEDNVLCYLVKTNEHVYHLTQNIYSIISEKDQLFNAKREQLNQLMNNDSLNNKEAVWQFGVKNLQTSLDYCEKEIANMMNSDNLKIYEHMASAYVTLAYCVQNKGREFEENFILYVLRAMKLGSDEGRQLFPYLLSKDVGTTYKEIFSKESSDIPTWMYLGWLPQLLANLDSEDIYAIADIIVQIAKTYPQAIMYPYRLSREMYSFKNDSVGKLGKEVTESLDEILLSNSLVEQFLKAMAFVSSPSNVLRYHVGKLMRACSSKEQFAKAYQNLSDELYSGIPDYKNAKNLQGAMFKHIAKYEAKLKNIIKGRFDAKSYQNALRTLDEELKGLNYKRTVKLADYSPWLANFQATELHANLEIPGQYSGERRPLVQYHTKIMGFAPTLLLMKSLRAPIRITMLGNDGKEYHYLNKFGEDLRQDQRIEQIFNLMNKILLHDADCSKRQLSICTYQVVPLNSRLGIIEWINKTKELKDFVDDGIAEQVEIINFRNSAEEFLTWIDKATPRGQKDKATDAEKYGRACLKYNRIETITKYGTFVNNLSLDVLRKSFWNISVNSETFFALRHKFATSYAVICISQWLLGIGDRHLSNTLISLCSGEAIGIDFGHAFGTGTQILGVPELVPFRLTPHILSLLQPMNEHGLLQETMIHCLRAFRKNKDLLLATMNVFIKEPSLDWLEFARRSEITSGHTISQEWYPGQKMDHAQRKFQGANSTSIMIEELKAGHSHNAQFMNAYINVVKGTPSENFRARKGDNLSEEDQVKCLLDHATDHNVLGRMYVGWQAWV